MPVRLTFISGTRTRFSSRLGHSSGHRCSRWLWLFALLVCSLGCQEKSKECQRFIGTVNKTLREIDARPQPKADDVAAVAAHRKALAQQYEALAKDVSKLNLSDPDLVARAERYSGLAKAAGAALTAGFQALKAGDPKAAEASQKQFDAVAQEEAALVREINDLCLSDEKP